MKPAFIVSERKNAADLRVFLNLSPNDTLEYREVAPGGAYGWFTQHMGEPPVYLGPTYNMARKNGPDRINAARKPAQ